MALYFILYILYTIVMERNRCFVASYAKWGIQYGFVVGWSLDIWKIIVHI